MIRKIFKIANLFLLTMFSACSLDNNTKIDEIKEDFLRNNIEYKSILDVSDTLRIDADSIQISLVGKSHRITIQDMSHKINQLEISEDARKIITNAMERGEFEYVWIEKKKSVTYKYKSSAKTWNSSTVRFAYYYDASDYLKKFSRYEIIEKEEKPTNSLWLYKISEHYIIYSVVNL